MRHLEILLDGRIDKLRSKIFSLQSELSQLEKLSSSPDQISKLIKSGLVGEKVKLGKIHTQIVIEAE